MMHVPKIIDTNIDPSAQEDIEETAGERYDDIITIKATAAIADIAITMPVTTATIATTYTNIPATITTAMPNNILDDIITNDVTTRYAATLTM